MRQKFEPLNVVRHGMVQTIASIYWPQVKSVPGISYRHSISIGRDGHLSVIENRPEAWQSGHRIVLLVHGLTGSEDSTHLIRLANAFMRRGILTIRMNMRGCGPGVGLSSGIYHSGRSEDTKSVLEWIGGRFPSSPVTQIGISLGGNATLKMAGEMGQSKPDFLDSIVSVSAPIDLALCSYRISHFRNIVFNRYFTGRLVSQINALSKKYPDKVQALPSDWKDGPMSLARFDDLYVAPVSGFKSGADYYAKCSSSPFIGDIRCRSLLLTAADDPIIDPVSYRNLKYHPLQDVIITDHGGHAAWISNVKDSEFDRFWMDRAVVDWVMSLR